jgi:hypothetical protein
LEEIRKTSRKDDKMILEKLRGYQAVEAYPEGWSCVNCGDEYTEKTIDAKDFYAIHTEHGTECLNCIEEEKLK